MTCYETLRASAPAADAPMAHHFVKWWRNKFIRGYKKFNIGTESERTDTEELIGRSASQCSAPPDLLPSEARVLLQPSNPSPTPVRTTESNHKRHSSPQKHSEVIEDKHSRLRYEELTCDVELQHPESSKQQPLQFSFTLYDLDGHGRMTKDDIAGIVSTIYESLGKSVTVPHYGSKTIQVRLTVIPEDGRRCQRERRENQKRRRKEPPTVNTTAKMEDANNISEDDRHERLSNDEEASSKSSCSKDHRPPQRPQPVLRQRPNRHLRKEHRERKHQKKRSGSLQRRELLEIIQANMEKNHLSFQTTRKPNEHLNNVEESKCKYQKIRNRSYTVNEKPTNAFQKVKPEANGYLDLASYGDSNLCRYDRYLHAVICSSARHAHTGYHQKHSQAVRHSRTSAPHPRSRSHDLPIRTPPSHPRVLQIIFL